MEVSEYSSGSEGELNMAVVMKDAVKTRDVNNVIDNSPMKTATVQVREPDHRRL